ncbi:sulfurtransferase [Ornithinibacillus contaminans]|uniref:sulfurtransferase n=1 Tax=Ornithinibacillus contaminans TaxID=694055 RepID=UPI000AE66AE2|nr:sulfurtransferase [Ornithinibacillus contaminans]
MGTYFILIVGSLLCIMLYRRYFPVRGIPCKMSGHDKTSTVVLDIRDYNIETNHNQSDMRIPYAYLKRFVQEIPHQTLHVIANDRLELNLGLRYLRSKGYQVASYHISNCPCREKE